jgi:hypothetical protein
MVASKSYKHPYVEAYSFMQDWPGPCGRLKNEAVILLLEKSSSPVPPV